IFSPSINHALSEVVRLLTSQPARRSAVRVRFPRSSRRGGVDGDARLEVQMKLRGFVSGLSLAAGAGVSIGTATAADLPVRVALPTVPPVAYVAPIYNWSRFYVGGHLGGGFEQSSWSDPFTGANNAFNKWGFLGGGQVGANIQFNALVL